MARNKGTFTFAANFQVKVQEALDPRLSVSSKADLINKETWPYDGDTLYLYPNLIVGTPEGVFMLTDVSKALNADYSGWLQIDASAAKIELVDNLESESTTAALTARQGKVLMTSLSTLQEKLTAIYTPKGSVAFADLPTDGMAVGDVYNITDSFELDGVPYAAGTNVYWLGTSWDALGGSFDLSNYYTKTETDSAIDAKIQTALSWKTIE